MNIQPYEAMAKLDLPEDERRELHNRAEALLKTFSALESVDTDDVTPLTTPLEVENVLREDTAAKLITREALLANAPEQYDGYFQVPKTLD